MPFAPSKVEFEISPLIFPVGKETTFTLRSLAAKKPHAKNFPAEESFIEITRRDAGSGHKKFTAWNLTRFPFNFDEEGKCTFTYTAQGEGLHAVRLFNDGKRRLEMGIYALMPDLMERTPLRGDFHTHTIRSDGTEDPAIVCANYRGAGYDFITITDHKRYHPSLEAINFYKDIKTGLEIIPGEEIHLPGTSIHLVNAGGKFSVNGLLDELENYTETDGSLDGRRLDDTVNPPPVLNREEYELEIDKVEAAITDCPDNVEKRSYAVCKWAFDRIKEGEGLSIYAHPMWLADMWSAPEPFTRYMFETKPFDALEVLGGETYYEQNGLQTAIYYDECAKGRRLPIVGSTDSHCSEKRNPKQTLASTIVFAKSSRREDILQAVKDGFSVAVDTLSSEYRLVGEYRYQKYACFLVEHFYPAHDRLARLSGEMMYFYAIGKATKEEVEGVSAKLADFFTLMIGR